MRLRAVVFQVPRLPLGWPVQRGSVGLVAVQRLLCLRTLHTGSGDAGNNNEDGNNARRASLSKDAEAGQENWAEQVDRLLNEAQGSMSE
jgi:hypothetical protein